MDIIKVRIQMRPCWVRVGPKSSECHFKRQKMTQRHRGRRFFEDRGVNDVTTSKGAPGAPLGAGRDKGGSSPRACGENVVL